MNDLYIAEKRQLVVNNLKHKVKQRGDLPHASIVDQLEIIEGLSQFRLGCDLLDKGFIDTFWTDYIISHPSVDTERSQIEEFILNRSPFTQAWREVLSNFQKIIQKTLREGITLASIPCGAMRELLELDYSFLSNFTLIGIDIDKNSLELAKRLAEKQGLFEKLKTCQEDAWNLPYNSEIDLIASCGLNIYVFDKEKVVELYRQFYKALKPNGLLVISFLTYPPEEEKLSEWKTEQIPAKDLILERIIYKDLLNVKWRNFKTSKEFENELLEAGFSEVTFHYDTLHVFPTVVAKKCSLAL